MGFFRLWGGFAHASAPNTFIVAPNAHAQAGSTVSTGVADNGSAAQAEPVVSALRDTLCLAFHLAYHGEPDCHPPTHHLDPSRAEALYALLTLALICSSDVIA